MNSACTWKQVLNFYSEKNCTWKLIVLNFMKAFKDKSSNFFTASSEMM